MRGTAPHDPPGCRHCAAPVAGPRRAVGMFPTSSFVRVADADAQYATRFGNPRGALGPDGCRNTTSENNNGSLLEDGRDR